MGFSFVNKAVDGIMGDNIGGIGLTFPEEDANEMEPKKEEVLNLVKEYRKQDDSITKELATLADEGSILERAKEILLGNTKKLKDFLVDLIKADKSGDMQGVINDLTTAPEPVPEKEKAEEKPAPTTPTSTKIDRVMLYEHFVENPEDLEWVKESTFQPKPVSIFFNRQDLEKERMLTEEDIKPIVATVFHGNIKEACGPNGWYIEEVRVADKSGKPTSKPFPTGKGK